MSDPSGVDELVIPTPSPDPGDFAARITNPWLPLYPGAVWEYDVSGPVPGTRTVTVVDGTTDVAGVDVTGVRQVTASLDGTTVAESVDYFAQDRQGNVWAFGRDQVVPDTGGSWRAGVDGAEAGLEMPAQPRVGDGFRQELAPGLAEDIASVESLDATRSTPAGEFDGLVQLAVTTVSSSVGAGTTSSASPGTSTGGGVDRFYAHGVGLVQEYTPQASVSLSSSP